MSRDAVHAFVAAAEKDQDLQMLVLAMETVDEVVAAAQDRGFRFTAEELVVEIQGRKTSSEFIEL